MHAARYKFKYMDNLYRNMRNVGDMLKKYITPKKLIYLIRFYNRWRTNYGFIPKEIEIRLTWRCNAKCAMCPIGRYQSNKPFFSEELSTKRVVDLLTELESLGTTYILFSGGEPTLRKDLSKIISFAAEIGMKTGLNTNGYLMSESMAMNLVQSGLSLVSFSIDAPDPYIHNNIRGVKDMFEKVTEGVKNIKRASVELNRDVYIHINCVIMKTNYKILDQFFDYKNQWGYNAITFSSMIGEEWDIEDISKDINNLKLTHEEIMDFNNNIVPKIIKKSKNTGISTMISYSPKTIEKIQKSRKSKKMMCIIPWIHAIINPNGDVLPCCILPYEPDFILGNVKEKRFYDIWNGKRYIEFRKKCKPVSFPACFECTRYFEMNRAATRILSNPFFALVGKKRR